MVMNAFVWIFYIFVPVGKTESGSPRYIEAFTWLQLAGFMVLVFGVMVYNEIIVIPWWGFNRYTRIAIEEREK